MALDGLYYPHAISGNTLTPYITPFDSVDTNYNYQMIENHSNADPTPCFVSVMQADPQIDFTSRAVANVLNIFTNTADSLNVAKSFATDPTFSLLYAKGAPQGFRTASGSAQHIRGLMDGSVMIYWNSITARQDELATINATIAMVRKNNSTDPLVFVGNVNLSSYPSACQQTYTLGPVYWAGVRIDSVIEMTWENNVRRLDRRTAGDITPCWQSIDFIEPMVSFVTEDLENIVHSGSVNANATNDIFGGETGAITVYLRKKLATGTVPATAEGVAQHIKLTSVSSASVKKVSSITGTAPGQARVEVSLAGPAGFDTSLFTIDLASTIP